MIEEKKVKGFYEKDAEKYDKERFISDKGRYEDELGKNTVFSMLDSWKNLNVLELGCGTGRFSIELSKRSGIATALDITLPMLRKIKEKINIIENKIGLICGSGHKLPFKDQTFDGVLCINVLTHLPNYEEVFAEIYRVLKPNAFFIFNFANLYSVLLPVGLSVNLRKRSLIRPVYTKWYNLWEIKNSLQNIGFEIEDIKSVFLPVNDFMTLQIVKKLNNLSRDTALKYISSGIIVKANRKILKI